jgi:hypothetical protein
MVIIFLTISIVLFNLLHKLAGEWVSYWDPLDQVTHPGREASFIQRAHVSKKFSSFLPDDEDWASFRNVEFENLTTTENDLQNNSHVHQFV